MKHAAYLSKPISHCFVCTHLGKERCRPLFLDVSRSKPTSALALVELDYSQHEILDILNREKWDLDDVRTQEVEDGDDPIDGLKWKHFFYGLERRDDERR